MKKVLSLVLALSLVFGAVLAVHADNTVSISKVTVNGANVQVDFNTSGLAADDQVTILTLADANPEATATSANIKYIDQIDKGSNTSISFALASNAAGTYQVKMGGTDVASPALMSITVGSGMKNDSGKVYFVNNALNSLFAGSTDGYTKVTDEESNVLFLQPNQNYIAAYATAPALDGYTVKEYGVRLGSADYEAKIMIPSSSNYGVLFKGAGITSGSVTAFPYVTYEKAGEADITYYGTTSIGTIQ